MINGNYLDLKSTLMRTPILLLGLAVLFSSCSYEYVTIASDDAFTNDNNDLVSENDSVRIVYNFHGDNGLVNISIYNKMSEGLIVDWSRSALVIGETALVYYDPRLRIRGNIRTPVNQDPMFDKSQSLSATVQRDEAKGFIPPQSKITERGYHLVRSGRMSTDSMNMVQEKLNSGYTKLNIKKGTFTKSDSPIVFRSYLTFLSANNETQVFTITNSFYVSEVVTSGTPLNLTPEKNGNRFPLSTVY